jgi:hypothetical protein
MSLAIFATELHVLLDVRPHPPLVLGEAAGLAEVLPEHVRADQREAGALPGGRGRAVRGVAEQHDAAGRPGRQLDLAQRVEVEVVAAVHRGHQLVGPPTQPVEGLVQQSLLAGQVAPLEVGLLGGEGQSHPGRLGRAHRVREDQPARPEVHDLLALDAQRVRQGEDRDVRPEMP